ncbi:ATP-binding cassette domain-containing protein [Paenibacillus sp.]|uniref:ATP-binding cassette domain-containing protein n=1 Tax=Paenibacillus sp. TaxID=58172 RepID=UPI002D66FCAE|nr:ATP-binding cassette domain-containing protein [Paenibacillus sp.]HZG86846.1 ATP-binding cassette domain-containing protein [Paenibacillus sp.]
MTGVSLHDLLVVRDGRTLLTVPEARFAPGSFTCVVGPSGAGKSTLLRAVNLLERPRSGVLEFAGVREPLPAIRPRAALALRRRMAFVAQNAVLFQATVLENVALGLRYRGLPKPERNARAFDALALVGLEAAAHRKASTLSGGEAQRVALARAVVVEPELLLLDEPTSNLDPGNVELMEQALRRIRERRSTIVLMVTHQLLQARRLADECLFLWQGEIAERGPAAAFFERPRSELLRDFIQGKIVY